MTNSIVWFYRNLKKRLAALDARLDVPDPKTMSRGGMGKSWFDVRRNHRQPVGTATDLFENFDPNSPVEAHLRPLLSDPDLVSYVKRDPIPIPAPEDREGYHGERHFCYWLSGLYDYRQILKHIPTAAQSKLAVDFGGASGRVARHFASNQPETETIVADLNINHIDWINSHFPRNTRALKVSGYPHIMLQDSCCDLLCAFSVFTHIDAYELSWIAEIRRVLKSGGYAYLTVHSEHTWRLLPSAYVYRALIQNEAFRNLFREGQEMPEKRLVFEYDTGLSDNNCNVFHHSQYISANWGKWLEIETVIPEGSDYQTVVILRKPLT